MFDTPFDRYHDEAAAERREQEQFDEREQDGGYDPAEVTARQPKSRLMRVWIGVLIGLFDDGARVPVSQQRGLQVMARLTRIAGRPALVHGAVGTLTKPEIEAVQEAAAVIDVG